jgi:hypothetical protein
MIQLTLHLSGNSLDVQTREQCNIPRNFLNIKFKWPIAASVLPRNAGVLAFFNRFEQIMQFFMISCMSWSK